MLSDSKPHLSILLAMIILVALVLPVFAIQYNPGVAVGQYVKYGNFAGSGSGLESFNDYSWLKLGVTDVSGQEITLLSTGEFKNGTALRGNDTTSVWDVETGTDNGVPSTQGPIIAANLNQGDAIPPPNTYTVNQTESRTYLGVSRTVNILIVTVSTSDYNSTLTYIYDKLSGMLLESSTLTTTQAQPQPVTSTYSYSIIETNIFGPSPSPTVPEFYTQVLIVIAVAIVISSIAIIALSKRVKG
jgi:hypothetical protein